MYCIILPLFMKKSSNLELQRYLHFHYSEIPFIGIIEVSRKSERHLTSIHEINKRRS